MDEESRDVSINAEVSGGVESSEDKNEIETYPQDNPPVKELQDKFETEHFPTQMQISKSQEQHTEGQPDEIQKQIWEAEDDRVHLSEVQSVLASILDQIDISLEAIYSTNQEVTYVQPLQQNYDESESFERHFMKVSEGFQTKTGIEGHLSTNASKDLPESFESPDDSIPMLPENHTILSDGNVLIETESHDHQTSQHEEQNVATTIMEETTVEIKDPEEQQVNRNGSSAVHGRLRQHMNVNVTDKALDNIGTIVFSATNSAGSPEGECKDCQDAVLVPPPTEYANAQSDTNTPSVCLQLPSVDDSNEQLETTSDDRLIHLNILNEPPMETEDVQIEIERNVTKTKQSEIQIDFLPQEEMNKPIEADSKAEQLMEAQDAHREPEEEGDTTEKNTSGSQMNHVPQDEIEKPQDVHKEREEYADATQMGTTGSQINRLSEDNIENSQDAHKEREENADVTQMETSENQINTSSQDRIEKPQDNHGGTTENADATQMETPGSQMNHLSQDKIEKSIEKPQDAHREPEEEGDTTEKNTSGSQMNHVPQDEIEKPQDDHKEREEIADVTQMKTSENQINTFEKPQDNHEGTEENVDATQMETPGSQMNHLSQDKIEKSIEKPQDAHRESEENVDATKMDVSETTSGDRLILSKNSNDPSMYSEGAQSEMEQNVIETKQSEKQIDFLPQEEMNKSIEANSKGEPLMEAQDAQKETGEEDNTTEKDSSESQLNHVPQDEIEKPQDVHKEREDNTDTTQMETIENQINTSSQGGIEKSQEDYHKVTEENADATQMETQVGSEISHLSQDKIEKSVEKSQDAHRESEENAHTTKMEASESQINHIPQDEIEELNENLEEIMDINSPTNIPIADNIASAKHKHQESALPSIEEDESSSSSRKLVVNDNISSPVQGKDDLHLLCMPTVGPKEVNTSSSPNELPPITFLNKTSTGKEDAQFPEIVPQLETHDPAVLPLNHTEHEPACLANECTRVEDGKELQLPNTKEKCTNHDESINIACKNEFLSTDNENPSTGNLSRTKPICTTIDEEYRDHQTPILVVQDTMAPTKDEVDVQMESTDSKQAEATDMHEAQKSQQKDTLIESTNQEPCTHPFVSLAECDAHKEDDQTIDRQEEIMKHKLHSDISMDISIAPSLDVIETPALSNGNGILSKHGIEESVLTPCQGNDIRMKNRQSSESLSLDTFTPVQQAAEVLGKDQAHEERQALRCMQKESEKHEPIDPELPLSQHLEPTPENVEDGSAAHAHLTETETVELITTIETRASESILSGKVQQNVNSTVDSLDTESDQGTMPNETSQAIDIHEAEHKPESMIASQDQRISAAQTHERNSNQVPAKTQFHDQQNPNHQQIFSGGCVFSESKHNWPINLETADDSSKNFGVQTISTSKIKSDCSEYSQTASESPEKMNDEQHQLTVTDVSEPENKIEIHEESTTNVMEKELCIAESHVPVDDVKSNITANLTSTERTSTDGQDNVLIRNNDLREDTDKYSEIAMDSELPRKRVETLNKDDLLELERWQPLNTITECFDPTGTESFQTKEDTKRKSADCSLIKQDAITRSCNHSKDQESLSHELGDVEATYQVLSSAEHHMEVPVCSHSQISHEDDEPAVVPDGENGANDCDSFEKITDHEADCGKEGKMNVHFASPLAEYIEPSEVSSLSGTLILSGTFGDSDLVIDELDENDMHSEEYLDDLDVVLDIRILLEEMVHEVVENVGREQECSSHADIFTDNVEVYQKENIEDCDDESSEEYLDANVDQVEHIQTAERPKTIGGFTDENQCVKRDIDGPSSPSKRPRMLNADELEQSTHHNASSNDHETEAIVPSLDFVNQAPAKKRCFSVEATIHNEPAEVNEEEFYSQTNDPKNCSCDADQQRPDDDANCTTIEEHEDAVEDTLVTKRESYPTAQSFKWRYTPSLELDDVKEIEDTTADSAPIVTPLKTCSKPRRVGLSKKHRVKSLHPYLRK